MQFDFPLPVEFFEICKSCQTAHSTTFVYCAGKAGWGMCVKFGAVKCVCVCCVLTLPIALSPFILISTRIYLWVPVVNNNMHIIMLIRIELVRHELYVVHNTGP